MKDKLLYSAVGGCIGTILTLCFSLFSPLVAQNDVLDAEFGTITCKDLYVRGDDDNVLAYIGKSDYGGGYLTGGRLTLFNKFGKQIDLKAGIYGNMTIYDGTPNTPHIKIRGDSIAFMSSDARLEKIITESSVLSGPEWWNMFIQSEHSDEDMKDIAREQLRRY